MQTTEIVLPGIGEPETLRVRVRELPEPGAGQVVVRVEASGISFAEQQMRRGKYYDMPPFPFVPGYDLVGVVEGTGRRVAALTKTGGWADRVVLDEADLVPVPDGVGAAAAETVVVNGVTAWRMLHRAAKVRAGQTIVVLGANSGVGTILVQLARHAGIRVIGTASPKHHDDLRALGVEPLDYRAGDVPARVRELAPGGVAAVFDHVGGPGVADSWRMLAPGGTLVGYGSAATRDHAGDPRVPVFKLVARLLWWNLLPNGRHATFFDLWKGKRNLPRYRRQLHEDLTAVLDLLAAGKITARVAKEFPLRDAAAALRFAETAGVAGKVVLIP
ncbi:medium chain dehydrogenase/reductase family protein [Dactylosporangium sp. NBC_01737]|uniref:medium chain dehydrogenase/reductase family protein n=1 Tax=Dactylosporangium sp. NBC_01737 TaxID=2975959 RepID=UPI002E14AAC2|nr:medium chain dehydrogenase/reductase family protein [Dactylosporangium sp. NBC_01737]